MPKGTASHGSSVLLREHDRGAAGDEGEQDPGHEVMDVVLAEDEVAEGAEAPAAADGVRREPDDGPASS